MEKLPFHTELDLHTFHPGDIPSVVLEYLREARKARISEVRLIHGKGIGYQRQVVQTLLSQHPGVETFSDAPQMYGGRGATLAYLKIPRNPFLLDGGHSPHQSINQLPLVDLPDFPLEKDLRGQTAFPALSGTSLEKAAAGDWQLEKPETRARVAVLGRLLGRVITTLILVPGEAKAARTAWGWEEWDWWAGVDHVFLGGGAFQGPVGTLLRKEALGILQDQVPGAPSLEIPKDPAHLPLLGARLPGSSLALDWGQTHLKACTFDPQGAPVDLDRSPMPFPQWDHFEPGEEEAEAWELHRHLVRFSLGALKAARQTTGRLGISLANYLHQSQINPRGAYGKLRLLPSPYPAFFEQEINQALGSQLRVTLANDGVWASQALTHPGRSALVLWGTALGVGWPRSGNLVKLPS